MSAFGGSLIGLAAALFLLLKGKIMGTKEKEKERGEMGKYKGRILSMKKKENISCRRNLLTC